MLLLACPTLEEDRGYLLNITWNLLGSIGETKKGEPGEDDGDKTNGLGEKGGPVTLVGGGPVGVKGGDVTDDNLCGVKYSTIVSSGSSSTSSSSLNSWSGHELLLQIFKLPCIKFKGVSTVILLHQVVGQVFPGIFIVLLKGFCNRGSRWGHSILSC